MVCYDGRALIPLVIIVFKFFFVIEVIVVDFVPFIVVEIFIGTRVF